jgi:glycosyltransferase involved in cell wall biosynthesis
MYGKRPFKVIHNAIDLSKFAFNYMIRNYIRAQLAIENKFVIGHVGRYCYIKNQIFLLEVFAILNKRKKNAKLILIGKGEDEEMLRKKAVELDCAEDVLFLIDRPDVNELYQAMDVFVMPSLFEGLPVVSVEAQANGLPCILSDRISKEVCITDAVTLLSLEDSKEHWAKVIEMVPKVRINNNVEQLRNAGYDVKDEAKKLTTWYQEISSNVYSYTLNRNIY